MKDIKKIRTFGWGLSGFFTILGILKILFSGEPELYWHFYAALGTALINLVFPALLKPVYEGAMMLAHWLGWFNTRLLLGILYFLLFTPISIIFKVTGKDLLDRKFDKSRNSYWHIREKKVFDPKSVENQF